MAKITNIDNRDIFETELEIDGGNFYDTVNLSDLAIGVMHKGITLSELLAAVKEESEFWDSSLEDQLPIEVALKAPSKDKFILRNKRGKDNYDVPVDEIIANALDNSYDEGNAEDFIELIKFTMKIAGLNINKKTPRVNDKPVDLSVAIPSMPMYIRKYYRKLRGKVNEKDLIAYLGGADINNFDLDDEDVYDWSSIEGIQAIIDDINLVTNDKDLEDLYKEGLQWALNGWKNS